MLNLYTHTHVELTSRSDQFICPTFRWGPHASFHFFLFFGGMGNNLNLAISAISAKSLAIYQIFPKFFHTSSFVARTPSPKRFTLLLLLMVVSRPLAYILPLSFATRSSHDRCFYLSLSLFLPLKVVHTTIALFPPTSPPAQRSSTQPANKLSKSALLLIL